MAATVTLYTRAGCSLCEEALSALQRLRRRLAFEIELIDIDSDPALRERYNESVPVVALGGDVIAQAPLAPMELESRLASCVQAQAH
jgi:glutaredoxin